MTVWVLVAVVWFGSAPTRELTVWPGVSSAYGLPPAFTSEAACWRARKRVLSTEALSGWKVEAATCVRVKVSR